MTEEEWLTSEDARKMLALPVLGDELRRKRLYECGCCRLVWDLLTDARSQEAVGLLEAHADEFGEPSFLTKANNLARTARDGIRLPYDGRKAAANVVVCAASAEWQQHLLGSLIRALVQSRGLTPRAVLQLEASIVRDIFGNPFRPVAFDPAWRTDTAVALARQMYDSREFGAMPILADALQDAGCEDEHILNHCRDTSVPHVRGCWVVDLVLGKS